MVYVKKNSLDKIKGWNKDDIVILTDFDRTITAGYSESSWGVLCKCDLVPASYKSEREELQQYYRPFEIDESLDYETRNNLMIEWWNKHIALFVKYKIPKSVIDTAAQNKDIMNFRAGAKEFLERMHDLNIPIIIVSAGVGNFIEQILIEHECNFDNIHIVSNFIKFENGIASGISDKIIHSLNKDIALSSAELKDRGNIIVMGDMTTDINMIPKELRDDAFKIGFLDENMEENLDVYKEMFDIVGVNNTSYTEIFENMTGVLK